MTGFNLCFKWKDAFWGPSYRFHLSTRFLSDRGRMRYARALFVCAWLCIIDRAAQLQDAVFGDFRARFRCWSCSPLATNMHRRIQTNPRSRYLITCGSVMPGGTCEFRHPNRWRRGGPWWQIDHRLRSSYDLAVWYSWVNLLLVHERVASCGNLLLWLICCNIIHQMVWVPWSGQLSCSFT